jgi:2-haloacid dehalogenase
MGGLAPPPKALAFDVFGTVVDWHGGVRREAAALAAQLGCAVDAAAFASDWRAGYAPAMDKVRTGQLPWTRIDGLHRMILEQIIDRHGLAHASEAEREHLNRAWHRLPPWPDTLPGLVRLKRKFLLTTLSNGNFSLLTEMAKHAGLPWDCVISAELFGHYKPDPETYLGAARLLCLPPDQVMMVAAHNHDLKAAQKLGLKTAFVARPTEYGPLQKYDFEARGDWDIVAKDFGGIADRMGC